MAAAFPGIAAAQDAAPEAGAQESTVLPGQDADVDAEGDPAEGDTIIVTGSRIARPRDFTTPAPIISLGQETIQSAGTTNLTDFLTGYPALVGSQSSSINSGDEAGIGSAGLNLLDLRNLGTARTLVLVDGRRHVASVPGSQAVDINTIPSDLVERLEIVTGGASALYGADAVSGVVNFIMRKNFEGVTARAQAGISEHGDSGQRLLTITVGQNFAGGRGNVAAAYEFGSEDRLLSQDRRRYRGTRLVGFYNNPDDTETGGITDDGIPDQLLFGDLRYFDTTADGAIDIDLVPDLVGIPEFTGDGSPFIPGIYLGSGIDSGGSGTPLSRYANDLLPDIERHIFNLLARYEFSDAFEVYGEAKYARSTTFTLAQPTFDYYLFVPEDNPFIPQAARDAIVPGLGAEVFGEGTPDAVLVTRDNFDFGQRGQDNKRETYRGVLGIRGDITDAIRYDLSYVYGQSKVRANFINDIYDDRFLAALDAVVDPATGSVTCRANIEPGWVPFQPFLSRTGSRAGGLGGPVTFQPGECVPIDLFGEGQSQAALDFIRARTLDRSKIQQHVVSGIVTGTLAGLFELPGGAPGFAIGGEYRKEKSDFESDPIARQGLTFTNAIQPTAGDFDVKEVFGELNVPIVSDRPFLHRLEVGGAIRFSDYSTIGSTTTWQVNGVYAPIPDLSFKGTYAEAVRAPNISELFGGRAQTFQFITDPCDADELQNAPDVSLRTANCATLLAGLGVADPADYQDDRSTNVPGFQGGNPDLGEETAKIWTAGVALQPRFLPGFNATIDWYDIRLKNAIATVTVNRLAELCVDQPTLDNPFCPNLTRQNGPPTSGTAEAGNIVDFTIEPQNVAEFTTSGLDVNVSYTLRTDTAGTFNLRVIGSYLKSLKTIGTPGATPIQNAGTQSVPKYLANLDLTWAKGPVSLNYGLSWHDKTTRFTRATTENNPDIVAPEYLWVKERWQHDLYASFDVTDQFRIYGGINNFTDEEPDIGLDSYPVTSVGRFFYVGARINLDRLGVLGEG